MTIHSFKTKLGSEKIMSGGYYHKIHIWDIETGMCENSFDSPSTVIQMYTDNMFYSTNTEYPIRATGGRTTGELILWNISKTSHNHMAINHGSKSQITKIAHHSYIAYDKLHSQIIICSSGNNNTSIWVFTRQ